MKNALTETGQATKACLAFSPLLPGLGFILAILYLEPAATPLLFWLLMASVFLPLAGIAYACACIRCPACHCRWFWKGMNRPQDDPWLTRILTRPACPDCGKRFGG